MEPPSSGPTGWAPENVEDHLNARYIAVTGMTLMIWTHLTTLDEEIRYIWNKETRVTLNKILFGIVRYFATIMFGIHCLTLFLARPSFEVCRGMIISVGTAGLVLIGACDVILLLRTWGIYNRTRKSLICLVILLAVTHLPTLVLGGLWMTTLRIGPSKLYPAIPGCFLESTAPGNSPAYPAKVYNTALSGASMYKIWLYYRELIKTPLLSLLIRDGMLYYMIILIVYFSEGFFMFRRQFIIITIDGRFNIWLVAVACAQLQLNLRNAVHHVPEYVTTYYKHRVAFEDLNGRLGSARRPGVDTLIFGHTLSELEHDSSSEREVGQEEEHDSRVIELVPTSAQDPQRTMGHKQAPLLPNPLNDIGQVPSPRSLESPSRGEFMRSAPDSDMELHPEAGISPMPRSSLDYENTNQCSLRHRTRVIWAPESESGDDPHVCYVDPSVSPVVFAP